MELEKYFVETNLENLSIWNLAKNFVISNCILILVYFIYYNLIDIENLKKDTKISKNF